MRRIKKLPTPTFSIPFFIPHISFLFLSPSAEIVCIYNGAWLRTFYQVPLFTYSKWTLFVWQWLLKRVEKYTPEKYTHFKSAHFSLYTIRTSVFTYCRYKFTVSKLTAIQEWSITFLVYQWIFTMWKNVSDLIYVNEIQSPNLYNDKPFWKSIKMKWTL
jgi:hypothetical protein